MKLTQILSDPSIQNEKRERNNICHINHGIRIYVFIDAIAVDFTTITQH